MVLIKARVQPSPVHGLGLFATERIAKGMRIWQFSPLLDREIAPEDFQKLTHAEQEYVLFYGFLSKRTGNYHLSFDNVKFINHSLSGNVATDASQEQETEYPLIAVRDIESGEEILQNYKEFEESGHGL